MQGKELYKIQHPLQRLTFFGHLLYANCSSKHWRYTSEQNKQLKIPTLWELTFLIEIKIKTHSNL